jgi:hypothetical protein
LRERAGCASEFHCFEIADIAAADLHLGARTIEVRKAESHQQVSTAGDFAEALAADCDCPTTS